jgi:ATP-dependent Lon protease
MEIVTKYSLKKIIKNSGLEENSVILSEKIANYFVEKISPHKSGMRELEQSLSVLVNKISFLVNNKDNIDDFPFKISFKMKEKLEFPVTVTEDIIDTIFKVRDTTTKDILSHMYL